MCRRSFVVHDQSTCAEVGRVQGEIAFVVRALKRADRGAFQHDVVNDSIEN
jgi:hypothetical protein